MGSIINGAHGFKVDQAKTKIKVERRIFFIIFRSNGTKHITWSQSSHMMIRNVLFNFLSCRTPSQLLQRNQDLRREFLSFVSVCHEITFMLKFI